MAARPPGSRPGSRDRLNDAERGVTYLPHQTAAGAPTNAGGQEHPTTRGRSASRELLTSRSASQDRLGPMPPPKPTSRPASSAGLLESEPAFQGSGGPNVISARRGSAEILEPKSKPAMSYRSASQEYIDRSELRPETTPASGGPRAAAAQSSASRERLDPESLYAPLSVPRSASRELLDHGSSSQQPGYERRFQVNASGANLYSSKAGDASRSSSVASLSTVGRVPPKYSQKPYFPSYTAPRYSRPKHISTTREPGYYNLNTDTVVRTKKHRTRTFLYVGRPWTKGFSTTPRNFLSLAVVAFFFCPPLGLAAIILAVMSRKAAVAENNAAAGWYGVIAFRLSVATMIIGVICWIALIALIHGWRFIGHRIH